MSWDHFFLGLLQGITEFLPISSSGHLFLAGALLKKGGVSLSLALLLHLATLISIAAVFFKDIKSLVFGFLEKKNLQLVLKVLAALAPLVFVGLFFKSFVEQSFGKSVVSIGFLSSGLLLLSLFFVKSGSRSLNQLSFSGAFLIGAAQALAALPGFSRAGWTISAALYCGLKPRAAVFFSFLISIPAVFGSAFFEFIESLSSGAFLESGAAPLSLLISFFTAFLSGFFSLKLVLKSAKKQKLAFFSFYLIPLSLFVFLFL